MATVTLADQAYDAILEQILSQTLRPGDAVDRKRIADELGVSLIPVSDAVQRLAIEGFLTTVRRHGTFVRVPDAAEIRGQLLVREALEAQAARLYAGEPLKAEMHQLRVLACKVDRQHEDEAKRCRCDVDFHLAMIELSGCRALIDNCRRALYLALFHGMGSFTQGPEEYHEALLSELCHLDADGADARIRRHIRAGKDGVLAADGQTGSGRSKSGPGDGVSK